MPPSQLKKASLKKPFIGLAPMEGVLDPLLRQMVTQTMDIDCCTTEFLRVTDKLIPDHMFFRYAPELNSNSQTLSGTPVLLQLLGGKPKWMALNAHKALELGARGIDINFGCPAKKVNQHDGGAALLKCPDRLYQTIVEIRKLVGPKAHVSAKVRLGFSDKSQIKEIAQACAEGGATWMTVHARTKEEGYRPPAHWESIAKMKDAAPKLKILANGDIWSLKDYQSCLKSSGCTDVMIGRGLMRNPFLAQEIKGQTELPILEKNRKTLSLMKSYLKQGALLYGEFGALGRIKQWSKMASQPDNPFFKSFFEAIKQKNTLAEALPVFNSKKGVCFW